MEHLTKQQIILVTLLVSFVTSIATGIVTVTLMDQAPQGVTHTINRVVERTVERVIPSEVPPTPAQIKEVIVSSEEALVRSTEKAKSSLVTIERMVKDMPQILPVGMGVMINKNTVLTDVTLVNLPGEYRAVLVDGTRIPLTPTTMNFSNVDSFSTTTFTFTSLSTSSQNFVNSATVQPKIGQLVYSFDWSGRLVTGYIEGVYANSTTTRASIQTSISPQRIDIGSPLFSLSGEIIGMRLYGDASGQGDFTPIK